MIPAGLALGGIIWWMAGARPVAIIWWALSAVLLAVILREKRKACYCGHPPEAHGHYRPGGECGLCECRQWRRLPWRTKRNPALPRA